MKASLAPLRGKTIGVIGAGKMGQALIKGLLAQGLSPRRLWVAEANAQTRQAVRRMFRVRVSDDAAHVVCSSDIVILAVKPQQFPEVIAEISPHVARRHLVMSIAAGMTLKWLQARLPGVPLIRVMPNLPATVGVGFSAMAAGRAASANDRKAARALFAAVGEVVELPERYFDAVTAVSGSGPAYVFFLVQAWEEAARSLGLPPVVASRAIRQTLEGSVRLLQASQNSAEELMQQVASKRGTTEAALKQLTTHRVSSAFVDALRAAARRSKELSYS